jgi:signal transduction histidine kinase
MESVAEALGTANFPLTPLVVDRIAAMIDGDVVVLDKSGQVTASTISTTDTLQPKLIAALASLPNAPSPRNMQWNGQEYLVTVIHRDNVPRPGALFVLIPQEQFSALRRDSILPPLLIAVPTLILALILAMIISRRVGGRIDRVRELFRGLSYGDFQSLSISGRNDEIRDLLTSANELSGQLAEMQKELLRSERLQLLGQLSGGLAHQLRNSITGARLAIQLHGRKCESGDDEMLATAIAQLRLTEEQVSAVLSLRPDLDRTSESTSVDLTELVAEVTALLQPQCQHWNTEVTVSDRSAGSAALLVSATCVKGAVLNLVLNAIQAAGIGGSVNIVVSNQDNEHIIAILDSGPGFGSDASVLTEAFMTTKPDGIGLGLTIAEHAVQQEGGRLEIGRSGERTSVRICLPVRQCSFEEVTS